MGQDSVGSLVPPPRSSRATPEQVEQDCVQRGLGYPQGGTLHTLSGQSVPVTPTVKFFLMSWWNSPCLSYCWASQSRAWLQAEDNSGICFSQTAQSGCGSTFPAASLGNEGRERIQPTVSDPPHRALSGVAGEGKGVRAGSS